MALITNTNFKPPFWLFNGHMETIYPALFRKVYFPVCPENVRINTLDDDFFDLHYYNNHSRKTVIISHGLEGSNKRPYIVGMAKLFFQNGWNVIAWNYRGCNGELNNSIKSYHSGFTEDLEEVIRFADIPDVNTISLVGFSLGGNLTLKYLGNAKEVNRKIKNAVTFSVPLDLHLGCLQISRPSNILYSKRFLKSLKKKVNEKAIKFPEIQTHQLDEINDLKTFDDVYTAPMHGFRDAMDYYNSCSAISVLNKIQIPSLIVNALNDPFLPPVCYPYEALKTHKFVHLETPKRGGHVGFCSQNSNGFYWSEERSLQFIESTI